MWISIAIIVKIRWNVKYACHQLVISRYVLWKYWRSATAAPGTVFPPSDTDGRAWHWRIIRRKWANAPLARIGLAARLFLMHAARPSGRSAAVAVRDQNVSLTSSYITRSSTARLRFVDTSWQRKR